MVFLSICGTTYIELHIHEHEPLRAYRIHHMKLEILFILWQNFVLRKRSRALKIAELSREENINSMHCTLHCMNVYGRFFFTSYLYIYVYVCAYPILA